MAKRFEGKTVLITGASTGIGLATALRIAKEGGKVALAARSQDKLDKAQAQIKEAVPGMEGKVITISCDVAEPEQIEAAVEKTVAELGGLDACFANAGFGKFVSFKEMTVDDYEKQMNTNLRSVAFTIKYAMAAMNKAGTKGNILVTSSAMSKQAKVSTATGGLYSASKAGADVLVQYAAIEGAETGIRVNSINPGIVRTQIMGEAMDDEAYDKWGGDNQLVGRAGRAEEIAALAAHLMSEEATFTTGSNIVIDGGWLPKA